MLTAANHNPDVLSCLANVSSDEVFTPPAMANAMLDLLPAELWNDPKSTFLDPVCKSGVFLREIAKRLDADLEKAIPNKQKRLNHILTKQVFGIAITELTALLARRSLYCSKTANGKYSVCDAFKNADGNIHFDRVEHTWKDGRCAFCGASAAGFDRGEELETHAYPFIHAERTEGFFDMKFDVIIGNPPYQLDTGGSGRQARPLYPMFVQQAQKLQPQYLTMIIPSRWFAGGMGLDNFRETMLHDRRISHLVDYTNAKDCFAGISISGGVCYFLWQRDRSGPCRFTSVHNGTPCSMDRFLDEFPVLVRYNYAVDIIHKVRTEKEASLSLIVSSINPFGFPTSARGRESGRSGMLKLYSSQGVGYVTRREVLQGGELIDKFKVMVSQTTSEHAGEPGKNGMFKLLSTVRLLCPDEVCTFSYITIGAFDSKKKARNLYEYLRTKFVRFLVLQAVSSIHLSREKFMFVPMQDFSKPWTDESLYQKYKLSKHEVQLGPV